MDHLILLLIAAAFILMLLLGIFASRIAGVHTSLSSLLLGGRNFPFWLGLCTMTATWVGGGFICGTAEMIYSQGFLWTHAPWGFALSLVVGGLFFARPMHQRGYTTLLDPFQEHYGYGLTALLYVPALIGEIFWSASVLTALGMTLATLLGISASQAILASTALAILYTIIGGFLAVAYADVVQLALMVAGLGLAIPYALSARGGLPQVIEMFFASDRPQAAAPFMLGSWLDLALLVILGGIPWGSYFQRVLACPTPRRAKILSLSSGFTCLLIAIPPALIGMIGATTDWAALGLSSPPAPPMILPVVIKYLTPSWVSLLVIAAVAAASLAALEASILSAASMFVWNILRPLNLRHREKNPGEQVSALRLAMITVGLAAAFLGIKTSSVYTLWCLSSELVYVVLFAQLLAVLFIKNPRPRGALAGMIWSLGWRSLCGETSLGIPSLIPAEILMHYPFRSLIMLSSFLCIWFVSRLAAPGGLS